MDYNTPGARESLTRADAHLTDDRKGTAPGVIHTNIHVNIGGQINHIVTYQGKTYLGTEGSEVRLVGGHIELV